MTFLKRIFIISRREIRFFTTRPLLLFCIVIAPILCIIYFTSMMQEGLPTKLPAGIVDEDNTHITRIVARILGSMEETSIEHRYSTFHEARQAMDRGEIYAFFYIPKGLTENAIANRQPKISFYTNETYFVPGTLLMKDMRFASELSGLALTRENLYAHGLNEDEAMGVIRPIVVEAHPIGNSQLDYSVYLNNIILPGIIILLIMLATTYTIGVEWKQGTNKEWYAMSGHSSFIALIGKLLPQFLWFSLLFIGCDIYFYKILGFPCNSGLQPMMLLGIVTVLCSQAFGILLFGLFIGKMRLVMCLCSLWGILSFSLTGFTYPVIAMDGILQSASWLFPLRHYYLIYVNQALNGYSISYVLPSVLAMVIFLLLPYTVLWRYRKAFLVGKYKQ